jgi:hypothetical protein
VTPSKTLIECSEAKVEYVPPFVCQECLAAPILVSWNRYTEVQDNVTHNEQSILKDSNRKQYKSERQRRVLQKSRK